MKNMKIIMENWRKFSTLNEELDKKKIYVLVGPPSVGKSTWIQKTFGNQDPYIINRDDIVEAIAADYGWTYDDMFMLPPPDAKEGDVSEKYGTVIKSPPHAAFNPTAYDKVIEANGRVFGRFNGRVQEAKGQPVIVVDMTNMTPGARKGALKAIEGSESDYHKVAVVFNFEGAEDIIKSVAAKRAAEAKAAGKSKTIPEAAFDRMFKSFQKVDQAAEGFDEVVSVDNVPSLKKVADSMKENKQKITKKYIRTLIEQKISEITDFQKKQREKENIYDDVESRFADEYPQIYGFLPSEAEFENMSVEEYKQALAKEIPEYAEELELQDMADKDKYGSETGDF
jgi:hypothetical protein